MVGICTYHLEVLGEVDQAAVNAGSPIQAQGQREETITTWLTIQADQSALVGMIRFLHQKGYVLLSVWNEPLFMEE